MAFACYCLQRAEFLYALDALVDCEIILGKSAMNTLCCHINSLGVISDMPLSRTSFCHLLSCCPPPCLQSREIKAFFVTPEIPLISQHVLRPSTDDVCDPSGLLHQKKNRSLLLVNKQNRFDLSYHWELSLLCLIQVQYQKARPFQMKRF